MSTEESKKTDFKAQVKQWMDGDQTTPLRITRKNGDTFVMVTQAEYEQMHIELSRLRGHNKGLLDVIHGRTEVSTKESLSEVFSGIKKK